MTIEAGKTGLCSQDRTTPLWLNPLEDENAVRTLVTGGEDKKVILGSLASVVSKLDSAGQTQFLETVFKATALEDDEPVTNRRDAAYAILTDEVIQPVLQANRKVVCNTYLKAVRSQDKKHDPLTGSIYTLLELGNAIAGCFPQDPQTRTDIIDAWRRVYNQFTPTDMNYDEQVYFYLQLEKLKQRISPNRQLDSQVEQLRKQGRDNKQIAEELKLSETTVYNSADRLRRFAK